MYVFSFPFITFSLLQRVYRFANFNVLLYILLNLRRTGAMCNLCCALLYILVKKRTYDESTGNSNKNSKDYNLYTLKTNAQDKHDFDLLFFYKVRGKPSRAQKICVLLLMQIFPPPVVLLLFLFFFEVRWFIVLSLQLVV